MIEAILGGIFYLMLVFIGIILLKTIRKELRKCQEQGEVVRIEGESYER